MLRYICQNPQCLNTFLSPKLEKFKKCELCGELLVRIGKPGYEYPYSSPLETIEELKIKYIELRKKSLSKGLTKEECLIVGRGFRKIAPLERKKLLEENGLWDENVIYKHIVTKDGLSKMVVDKQAMYYRNRKKKKANDEAELEIKSAKS